MVEYVEGIRLHGGQMDEATARELCRAAEAFVKRDVPRSIGIVHGHQTFLNLVVRGDDGCLVDFELAQVGDPLFDIATADLLAIRGDSHAWSAFVTATG
jgi:aminoglycoside phosphotransferase (APT) family kinase protein